MATQPVTPGAAPANDSIGDTPVAFPAALARYLGAFEAFNASTKADHDRLEQEYMASLELLDAATPRNAGDFVRKFYAMWGEAGNPNEERKEMMVAQAMAIIWPAKDAEALEPSALLSDAGSLLSQARGVIDMTRHYIENSCPGAGSSLTEALYGAMELIQRGTAAIDQADDIIGGRG